LHGGRNEYSVGEGRMKYLVRFEVEVEIESEGRNDLAIIVDAVKYALKEEVEQDFNTKIRPCHVEPKEIEE